MSGPEIAEFIKTVGIPAGIAFYVLWRFDKRLADLVNELRAANAQNGGVKEHVTQVGDRVIHEVDHNFRNALARRFD